MITEIAITNFKAIGEEVTIPIRPITLLFGANSCGKSSILQCLMLMRKIQNGDAEMSIDTFQSLIYQHDTTKKMKIAFKCNLDGNTLEKSYEDDKHFCLEGYSSSMESLGGIGKCFNNTLQGYKHYKIVYVHSISTKKNNNNKHFVSFKIDLFIGSEDIPVISYDEDGVSYNYNHSYWDRYVDIFKPYIVKTSHYKRWSENLDNTKITFLKVYEDHAHSCFVDLTGPNFSPDKILGLGYREILQADHDEVTSGEFDPAHPLLLIPSLSQTIRRFFLQLDHIGPLRKVPERYYLPGQNENKWVKELGNNPDLLKCVNYEFHNLQTGYRIETIKLTNPAIGGDTALLLQFVDLRSGTKASIKDVGFGFSQVMPIVLKSRLAFNKQMLIEQPELHLHPAKQAELGDLFIRCTKGEEHSHGQNKINHVMLETHSEHLILRLLRRIRETTDDGLPGNVPPISPDDIAILYVQPDKKGAEVIHIPITEDGDFASPWPQGFFPERSKELF